MKYIYSFWSKPLLEKKDALSLEDFSKLLKAYIKFYGISLNLAKKGLEDIELITDDYGYRYLKYLPYSKIRKDLNDIRNYSGGLWSLGKIYSLSLYNEPVCYIDCDFFIKNTEKFKNKINTECWDIITQSKELNPSFSFSYSIGLKYFFSILDKNIKKDFPEFLFYDSYGYCYNDGILGFKNLQAKKEYTEKAIKLFNYFKNNNTLERYYDLCEYDAERHQSFHITNINCIIEQSLLCFWANYKNFYVKELSPVFEWDLIDKHTNKFSNFQNETDFYKHYIGELKKGFDERDANYYINLFNNNS